MHCNNITDESVKYLTNLHTLNLNYCEGITDDTKNKLKQTVKNLYY